MRPKTLLFVLAAACLLGLLARQPTSTTATKHLDVRQPLEAAPALAFRHPRRPRANRPIESFALIERTEARGNVEDEQTAAGRGGELAVTPELMESALASDDEASRREGLPEEEPSIYASAPTREFRQWRGIFADEAPDATWSAQLRSEMTERMGDRLRSAASLHQIDCRETVCQFYLHTDDVSDAETVLTTLLEDQLGVAHQQIAANVVVEGTPSGGVTEEVVIRRNRPTWMPPHMAGAARAHQLATDAREATD